ncbi:autotransporter-associated beta strand repeat-containing protein [Diaphorobacter aerolatus]|uniref:Autotransporter-associated beta strand repeat-containing protein n=1 Tax=Diaphorobacter aerolatus TaxID=1288495 RepID=A0A7H0GKH9_9BURK|nr:autotransporter-associated beta strand repeat-containing protein [Diaphorobacter aerolatus]QNP48795.1 autotransporter-associated beta strand repeat-containing protein [Diaphorobacter aerolatus]
MPVLLDLMTKMVTAAENRRPTAEISSFRTPLRASVYGERMYQQLIADYTATTTNWTLARLNTLTAGLTGAELAARFIKMENDVIDTAVTAWEKRINVLSAKTSADYAAHLIKTGGGTLTLSGANTYTGNTEIRGGVLRTGVAAALANSPVSVAVSAVFDVTPSGDASVAGLANAGTTTLADGIAGQVLTVNGPWDGQRGEVRLDVAPAPAKAQSKDGAVAPKAAAVIADQIVITGSISGTTLLSLAGEVDPALLVGVPLITSTQPIPVGSFALSAPISYLGTSYSLAIDGGTVTLAAVPAPVAPQAVPVMGVWGLGALSGLLAAFAAFFSRRKRFLNA